MHRPDPFVKSLSLDLHGRDSAVGITPLDSRLRVDSLSPSTSHKRQFRLSRYAPNLKPTPSTTRRSMAFGMGSNSAVFPVCRNDATVVEPLRVLQQCICYFASHPDLYGTNLRALLERELVYVMRIKASETALVVPREISVEDVALPPISSIKPKFSGVPDKTKTNNAVLDKCAGWTVAPHSLDAALNIGNALSGPDGIFGYGGTSFVEATPGFMSLIDRASRRLSLHENGPSQPLLDASNVGSKSLLRTPSASASNFTLERPFDGFALGSQSGTELRHPEASSRKKSSPERLGEDSQGNLNPLLGEGAQLIVDGAGYEVSFLRSQLQQVEAAYNAKCIGLHELRQENNRNIAELNAAKKKLNQQSTSIIEMTLQMENMKRELDAWKQRASDMNLHGQESTSNGSVEASRRMQAMQLGDTRRELANLSRLWRETERTLQETKRSLEGAVKESILSHNYLEDAFQLIERLERRITRRDAFIETQRRRHASLEEKYEKLIWCFHELETIRGGHSYVDYLLSDNPAWALFLFVRLQRRFCAFLQVEEPQALSMGTPVQGGGGGGGGGGGNSAIGGMEPLLMPRRTPFGGKITDAYSPLLLYTRVIQDVTGRSPLVLPAPFDAGTQGSFCPGCRCVRWRGDFAIDYLTFPRQEASELARHNFPVLTLASLLLPQVASSPITTPVPATGVAASLGGDQQQQQQQQFAYGDIPNSQQYDQATVRLLLYAFWGNRLTQYKREMERRFDAMRRRRSAKRSNSPREGEQEEEHELENSTEPRPMNFLAALIDFVHRLLPSSNARQAGSSAGKRNASPISNLAAAGTFSDLRQRSSLLVRGNITRSETSHLDTGRFFVASIFTSGGVGTPADGTENLIDLSPQARELLYALYYYAEEYKESDADLQLFYLVSHQQLPELVAINFYASMEALREDCDTAIRQHISGEAQKGQGGLQNHEEKAQQQNAGCVILNSLSEALVPHDILPSDTPLSALQKAVETIDRAPLVDEEEDLLADSEGEGYGFILPGGRESEATLAPRLAAASATAAPQAAIPPKGVSARTLKHNISEYLFPEGLTKENRPSTANVGKGRNEQGFHDASHLSSQMPPGWVQLDDALNAILGSHASLLEPFQEARARGGRQLASTQLNKRQQFARTAPFFSASRGLLSCDEVLALAHKHCFASYALSCCGTPRFSLFNVLCAQNVGDSTSQESPLLPMAMIGQLPPTETHIRRLRFAISLDQPSTLIHYPDLFAVDPHCGAASHFHDEYLRMTIEVHLKQQEAWMDVFMGACAARHGSGVGAEDCDGGVSFPFIRRSVGKQFEEMRLGAAQSNLFAKHFLNYCGILRHEDDIRLEQFADAPFFINTPSLPPDVFDSAFAKLGEQRWPVEEEAAVCTLHHLALAVRMTYVVWGFDAAPSAHLAMTILPHAAREFRTRSSFTAVNAFGLASKTERLRGVTLLDNENEAKDSPPLSSAHEEESVALSSPPSSIQQQSQREEQERTLLSASREAEFVAEVQRDYRDAVLRMNTGLAQHNVLRRIATELRAQNDLEKTSPTTVTSPPPPSQQGDTQRQPTPATQASPDEAKNEESALHLPSLLDDAAHRASLQQLHGDIRRLYAAWDVEQREATLPRSTASPPRGGRNKQKSPKRRPKDVTDTTPAVASDLVTLPASYTLSWYMGLRGQVTRGKGDKRRPKATAPRGAGGGDVQAVLKASCQVNESVYMTEQANKVRRLVYAVGSAALRLQESGAVSSAVGVRQATESNGDSSANMTCSPERGRMLSVFRNTFEGDKNTGANVALGGDAGSVALRDVFADCAALSLM